MRGTAWLGLVGLVGLVGRLALVGLEGLVGRLAPMAIVATLVGACAAQHFCESDVQCRSGEFCELTTNQCINNPCHGALAGAFVRCDGGDAVMCDDAGRPALQSCGALGCEPSAGGCRPCEPQTLACYGDTLVVCGDQGEVLESHQCSYGCNGALDPPGCHDCRPYTEQCHENDLVRCGADGHVVTREICDHGCNTDRSACNACEPGLDYCEGYTLAQCDTAGLSGVSMPCAHGCSAQRRACNECDPDQVACDGAYRVTCGPEGLVAQGDLCVHGCAEQRAQCNECTPGTQQCDGNGEDLVTCTPDGLPGAHDHCTLGCNQTVAPPRCYTFTPTALSQSDLQAGTMDLIVTTPITIDTDAQTVNGVPPLSSRIATQPNPSVPAGPASPDGPDLFVVHYRDIIVFSTGFITVVGSRGLALVASGRTEIHGTIDAAATQGLPGPGGRDNYSPPTPTPPPTSDGQIGSGHPGCGLDRTGGGGAGHAAPGGNGGPMLDPTYQGGVGGAAIVFSSPMPTPPTPLQGGSAGGLSANTLHLGGAGGGLLLLAAAQEVLIDGHIDVSGGGGTAYGAGGGSAGTLLIEAPTVTIDGTIHAVGGGGACGGASLPGNDGAHGGRGCHSPDLNGGGGNGGLAGNRLWSPSGGQGIPVFCIDSASSGGGGASAGRLHLRATASGLTISPFATLRAAPCSGGSVEDCFEELVGE